MDVVLYVQTLLELLLLVAFRKLTCFALWIGLILLKPDMFTK